MKKFRYYPADSTAENAICPLLLIGQDGVLEELHFPNKIESIELHGELQEDPTAFSDVVAQLDEYFSGTRKAFQLSLNPHGTDFQKRVWKELQKIGYGQTTSYSEIAKKIGNPKACRAIGLANGKNPIPIIIPCHRVIGKNGSLTGFGGGLTVKKQLLDLEMRNC